MKILVTSESYLPRKDGVSISMSEIVPRLSKNNEVEVIAPDYGKSKEKAHNNVHRIPLIKIRFGDMYFGRFCFRTVKKYAKDADVIFNQSLGPIGISSIIMGKLMKKKVVSYIHLYEWELVPESIQKFKGIMRFLMKIITRVLYNRCDLLLCPNEEAVKKLNDHGIKTRKKVVPLGIDNKKFVIGNKEKTKKKLGLKDKIVVGFVGRFGKEKDTITLFNAYKKLKKKYKNLVLLLVGGGPKIYMNQFKYNGVIMPGTQTKVVPFYQAMDIYVLPSLTETSSLSTMEAMSCGLPVIATPVGLVKEYVVPGKTGFLFEKRNSIQLAWQIENLINNEKLRQQIGKQARKEMKKYDWDITVEEIIKSLS